MSIIPISITLWIIQKLFLFFSVPGQKLLNIFLTEDIINNYTKLIEKDGGTIIRDRVFYKLPGWIPGDIIAYRFVRKELEKIFLPRREVVAELFRPEE